jgi:hypothetical protein
VTTLAVTGWKDLLAAGVAIALVGGLLIGRSRGRGALWAAVLIAVLAIGTLYVQYLAVGELYPGTDSNELIEGGQLWRHEATLRGDLGDPWIYRLGAEWLAAAALWLSRTLDTWRPELVAFLGLRLVQNLAIFALAWMLLRRLGARREHAALGLCLVAFAMTNAHYRSALSYDTYQELVFFLAAAFLARAGRFGWLVPLTAAAAATRETGALIGLIPLALAWTGAIADPARSRAAVRAGAASLLVGAVVIAAIRLAVGPADLVHPEGEEPGAGLLWINLSDGRLWANVFATVTLVPFLAVAAYRRWPAHLRAIALAIVPIWIAVHFVAAAPAETRLLLVPYVLVAVPGALAWLRPRPDG